MNVLFVGGVADGKFMEKPPHSPWRVMGDPPCDPVGVSPCAATTTTTTIDSYVEVVLGDYIIYIEITMTLSQAVNQLLKHYKRP